MRGRRSLSTTLTAAAAVAVLAAAAAARAVSVMERYDYNRIHMFNKAGALLPGPESAPFATTSNFVSPMAGLAEPVEDAARGSIQFAATQPLGASPAQSVHDVTGEAPLPAMGGPGGALGGRAFNGLGVGAAIGSVVSSVGHGTQDAPSVLDQAAEALNGELGRQHADTPAEDAATRGGNTDAAAAGETRHEATAVRGAHGSCNPIGRRDSCPGYDEMLKSQQLCESLSCCWAEGGGSHPAEVERKCYARTPDSVEVAPGQARGTNNADVTGAQDMVVQPTTRPVARPDNLVGSVLGAVTSSPRPVARPTGNAGLFGGGGDTAAGTQPLAMGACAGDAGLCYDTRAAHCSVQSTGKELCAATAGGSGEYLCCPTGGRLAPLDGQADDNGGEDNLLAEEEDDEANGAKPERDGDLCGNYVGQTVQTIRGNSGDLEVVGILPQHFTGSADNKMTLLTACAFDTMATAAAAQGVTITIASGFRTYARQVHFWETYGCARRRQGANRCPNGPLAARPGTSKHGTGHALDLNTNCGRQNGNSPPGRCTRSQPYAWLAANAGRYGFKRTVRSEPWHWERS